MKKLILLGFLFFGLIFISDLNAGEKPRKIPKKEKKAKNTKPQLVVLTVTGIISQNEENKDQVSYILTSPSGEIISLPTPDKLMNPKKGAEGVPPEAINLEDFKDVRVTIFGKGFAKQQKNGQNNVSIKEIISITKVTTK